MSMPKKSLGQHWLHDDTALEAMIEAAEVQPGDMVLEVGPGLGTLTEKLLAAEATVRAVEFDQQLIPKLQKKFAHHPQFSLEQADILQFDLESLPPGYKVVANIPYYLTSNLLRRLCEASNPFSKAALLVQKEVAERVCAAPGAMSILSVSVQFYCEVSLGAVVPAELFTPPPQVDSQILVLHRRPQPLFTDVDTERFFQLVKAGFSERRKKLRSSLSGGLALSKTEVEELLRRAGISPDRRAQELTLQDWYDLCKML